MAELFQLDRSTVVEVKPIIGLKRSIDSRILTASPTMTLTDHSLRKVNTCKYPPIGSIIILPDDVYKSSKIMLPKEGLCL